MDASLSADDRAALKADAIERLRVMRDDLARSEERHRYRESGMVHATLPAQREWLNEAIRDLRRAGENVPDSMIERPHTFEKQLSSTVRADVIDGSALLVDIARVLAIVDLQPH